MPTPRPSEGKVLVKADTIGIGMPEVLVRKGVYAWMPPLPRFDCQTANPGDHSSCMRGEQRLGFTVKAHPTRFPVSSEPVHK